MFDKTSIHMNVGNYVVIFKMLLTHFVENIESWKFLPLNFTERWSLLIDWGLGTNAPDIITKTLDNSLNISTCKSTTIWQSIKSKIIYQY